MNKYMINKVLLIILLLKIIMINSESFMSKYFKKGENIFVIKDVSLSETIFNYEDILTTNFKNSIELTKFLKSKRYMFCYMDKVSGENMMYNPPLKKNSDYLSDYQIIEYMSKPNITFFKHLNSKINIKQIWDLSKEELKGNIETIFMSFNIKMSPLVKGKKIYMKLEAKVYDKKFFVPNMLIKYAIEDFKNIFNEIINEK